MIFLLKVKFSFLVSYDLMVMFITNELLGSYYHLFGFTREDYDHYSILRRNDDLVTLYEIDSVEHVRNCHMLSLLVPYMDSLVFNCFDDIIALFHDATGRENHFTGAIVSIPYEESNGVNTSIDFSVLLLS